MQDLVVNFSDPRERENFLRLASGLDGMQRVEIRRFRKRRSNPQNAYMWAVVLPTFVRFRHEQGEEFDADMAHEFFKLKFLRKTVIDMTTGEAIGSTVGSTAALDAAAFAEYLDKIIAWMADYGIVVPEPSAFYESEPQCPTTTK